MFTFSPLHLLFGDCKLRHPFFCPAKSRRCLTFHGRTYAYRTGAQPSPTWRRILIWLSSLSTTATAGRGWPTTSRTTSTSSYSPRRSTGTRLKGQRHEIFDHYFCLLQRLGPYELINFLVRLWCSTTKP